MKLELQQLQSGEKFKLSGWKGYWQWDSDSSTIIMHCANNSLIDIRDTNNVYMTLSNILSDDWEVATEDNCPVLVDELTTPPTEESFIESQRIPATEPVESTPLRDTVSKFDILDLIKSEQYSVLGDKTTICVLTLTNNFEVVGTSACVNPDNFDLKVGRKSAKDIAISKIFELEGYRLHWELYHPSK